ncbi:MAG TPA: DUF4232 domain-containing protein [Gaiellaceae bacterium]|nr:DUF4232 domain-containing protein [Gaiellaceae bacterium]
MNRLLLLRAVPTALLAALFVVPACGSALKAPPKCTTSGLVVWLNTNGDGAAGSTYFKLEFTNLSGSACTLTGYPGVSGVDRSGHQLGTAAGHDPATAAHTVTLANGATKAATLRIVEAGNFPASTCHLTTAAGLRVYPPNQTASKLVPFPFRACARTGPAYLSVRAVS